MRVHVVSSSLQQMPFGVASLLAKMAATSRENGAGVGEEEEEEEEKWWVVWIGVWRGGERGIVGEVWGGSVTWIQPAEWQE